MKANRSTFEGIRIDDLSMVFALDFLDLSKGALVQHYLGIKRRAFIAFSLLLSHLPLNANRRPV